MNHVTSVAWTGVCAVKKVIELNPFYDRGISIFTHCAQNCMVVLGMKAGAYVGQISDQTEGEGCDKKKKKNGFFMIWILQCLSVTMKAWTREPMMVNMKQTYDQPSWYLHLLPKSPDDGAFHHIIPPQKKMKPAASAFCFCNNLALLYQILLPLVWVSDCGLLTNVRPLVSDERCMPCSSFDGPSLVRCLITPLWQLNLSLRCSALEKYETLPGKPG